LRLAVDLGLEGVHVAVDVRKLETKIFAKLIDALTHDDLSWLLLRE
jgi:hypothetical protein